MPELFCLKNRPQIDFSTHDWQNFLFFSQAVLLTVDNKRLGVVLESHALIAQMAFDGKWRSCASKNILLVTFLPFIIFGRALE